MALPHESATEAEAHFTQPSETLPTEHQGERYRGWCFEGNAPRVYVLEGCHPCGYHMRPEDGTGRWRCISERALGRTYHRVFR